MTRAARIRTVLLAGLLIGLGGCGDDGSDASLEAGPHADLECAQCHTTPATEGFVAAVDPDSCAGCHANADLSQTVEIHNVSLTHLTHPGIGGSDPLDCASCHTHETGDADLTIATGACFLCHSELAAPGTDGEATIAASDCAACHVQPTHTAFLTSGAPIDHGAVLDRGISCLLCHYDVADGTGRAEAATCRTCHGVPGGAAPLRGGEAMDAATVHTMHQDTAFALSCTRCHDPVNHEVIQLASSLMLDCESCHEAGDPALSAPLDSTVHRASQELYAGLDPHHPTVEPALKFMERVACSGCHVESAMALPAGSADRMEQIRLECNACHGAGFGPLLGPWVAGMRGNTDLVGRYVQAAAADPRVRGNAAADSIARDAVDIWRHVSDGNGVHNLPGADGLLREALEAATGAYRRAGAAVPLRPSLGPDPDVVSCVRCHYGVQTIVTPAFQETFIHDEHVGAIACSRCHGSAELYREGGTTFDPAHGRTLINRTDCGTCHHVEQTSECASCHTRTEVDTLRLRADLTVHIRRDDLTRTRNVAFDHEPHASVECGECHQPGPEQPAIGCNECHESHHAGMGGAQTCNSCHGTNLQSLHQQPDHLTCGACHAPETLSMLESADRRFCMQCHVSMADHNPQGECAVCHLLLEPDEAMEIIVNARTVPRGRQ